MLLMENGFRIPDAPKRVACLIEKGTGGARLTQIIKEAAAERASGAQVLVVQMNKNKKFQKEQLAQQGYTEIREFFKNG